MALNLNPERALYLQYPALDEWTSAIASFHLNKNGQAAIGLEQTPFYPQSGGQPGDRGTITWSNGRLIVLKTAYDTMGEILHLGNLEGLAPSAPTPAVASIQADLRRIHSRLHTAGELICTAVLAMGYKWPVVTAKHFIEDSRVVFAAEPPPPALSIVQDELRKCLDELITQNTNVVIKFTPSRGEAERLVHDPAELPEMANFYRIVIIHGDRGRPCTGTHSDRLGDVGRVILKALKIKKGRLAVSYEVVHSDALAPLFT